MSVVELLPEEATDAGHLLALGALASNPEGFDPMDRAISTGSGASGRCARFSSEATASHRISWP